MSELYEILARSWTDPAGEKPDDELWARLEAKFRSLVDELESGAFERSDS